MEFTEDAAQLPVPTLRDAAAWIGPAPLVALDGVQGTVSVSLASENGVPTFAEIAILEPASQNFTLIASVRNWIAAAADIGQDDAFDCLVLHYLSADPKAFPPTAAEVYREPEFTDALQHHVTIDGSAKNGLLIERPGSLTGLITTMSGRLITCVWDAKRPEPALTTRGR